jgi:hypothetical protein
VFQDIGDEVEVPIIFGLCHKHIAAALRGASPGDVSRSLGSLIDEFLGLGQTRRLGLC